MNARKIELQFLPEDDRWRATGFVDGSYYCVEGGSADSVFDELCGMLSRPFDEWRVTDLAPGSMVCEELLRDDMKPSGADEEMEFAIDSW
jgi:hypothetical protein